MSLLGNIFKYLIVLILLALGVFVVLAGVMVLVPGFTLFGLHYLAVSHNATVKYNLEYAESAEWAETSKVRVITKGYSVYVRPVHTSGKQAEAALDNSMRVLVTSKISGFAWGDIREIQFTQEFIEENGETILKFEMLEPDGWLHHTTTLIEIVVSENDLANMDFEFISSSGTVTIGSTVTANEAYDSLTSAQTALTKATEAVETAQENLNNATTESKITEAEKALNTAKTNETKAKNNVETAQTNYNKALEADNKKIINLGSVYVENGSGKVALRNANYSEKVNIDKSSGTVEVTRDLLCDTSIKINGGLGKIFLNNVGTETDYASLYIEASNSEMRWNDIYGAFTLKAQGGYLKANNIIQSASIESDSCAVNLNNIGTTLYVNNGDGNVNINEVTGVGTVVVKGGSVNIASSLDKIQVQSDKGNITLKDVNKTAVVTSNYGQILIDWNEDLVYSDAVKEDLVTTVKVKYSTVEINDIIGQVNFSILDNGNGRITTRYKEVNGISQISTNTGSVTAILPFSETNPFTLNWKSEKNVDIRFGSCQPKAGDANIKEGSYNWNTTSNDGTIMLNSVSGIIKVRQIGDE